MAKQQSHSSQLFSAAETSKKGEEIKKNITEQSTVIFSFRPQTLRESGECVELREMESIQGGERVLLRAFSVNGERGVEE